MLENQAKTLARIDSRIKAAGAKKEELTKLSATLEKAHKESKVVSCCANARCVGWTHVVMGTSVEDPLFQLRVL